MAAIRLEHIVNVFITEDVAQDCPLFGKKDSSLRKAVVDSLQMSNSGKVKLTDASGGPVTESIPFGDVPSPIKGFYLRIDGDVDIVFNGGSDVLAVRKADSGEPWAEIFWMGEFTAIDVTNNDVALPREGVFAVWGDPVT